MLVIKVLIQPVVDIFLNQFASKAKIFGYFFRLRKKFIFGLFILGVNPFDGSMSW